MAQTDQDLQPIIRERTQGEKIAYQQGYNAALALMRRRIETMEAAAKIALNTIERPAANL